MRMVNDETSFRLPSTQWTHSLTDQTFFAELKMKVNNSNWHPWSETMATAEHRWLLIVELTVLEQLDFFRVRKTSC